jgi:hypothetical protein
MIARQAISRLRLAADAARNCHRYRAEVDTLTRCA